MNDKSLTRFWFEFEGGSFEKYPPGILMGCGVTAIDREDALDMVNKKVFKGAGVYGVKKITEDIDISMLDQEHVIPNMKQPVSRGIWFPLGYD